MSKFVNLNKRSVSLPKGCKDLIDLLQPPQECAGIFALPVEATIPDRIHRITAGLKSMEEQISGLFSSPQTLRGVMITTSGAVGFVGLTALANDAVVAFAQVAEIGILADIKSLFESRGATVSPLAKFLDADTENRTFLAYILPHAAREAAGIIETLFRMANGATDETDLQFVSVVFEESP